jgi:hypothetical protein
LPPPGGGLWGGAFWGVAGVGAPLRLQCIDNHFQDAVHICQNVVVPKTHNAKLMCLQPSVTHHIAFAVSMLSAVNFYDQTLFAAHEIDDIRSRCFLTNEFKSG